jgi:hypothetical protein
LSIIDGIGDFDTTPNEKNKADPKQALVDWCMSRVIPWRDARDQAYKALWGEYYRLWRGRHIAEDKTRSTERSKLVSPALAQALEMTVAELEEATFGRDAWIDILGNPEEELNAAIMQRQLLDDLDHDRVPTAIADCYLNGGLYGTLAGKVVVELKTERVIQTTQDESGMTSTEVKEVPYVCTKVIPIPPDELIPDPDATDVDEGLAIVHECFKSRSWLLSQPYGREYANMSSWAKSDDLNFHPEKKDPEDLVRMNPNSVRITEWHGLVPKRLLEQAAGTVKSPFADDPLAEALAEEEEEPLALDGEEMVEAIVTIFDEHFVGRAIENPFLMKDRSIIACAFERVPGRFWGRGVMEKGYNPQKGLDAELRSRMDALALITNPMVAADQTALPRGFDLRVYPGKVWMTNGAPKEALMPFNFPGLDQASFAQTAEMERMVQMGTGAMDSATPLEANRRNETLGGTSMIASTFVKRAKRALRNISKEFTEKAIQKIVWRRQQYDPSRYPGTLRFRIIGSLGIVARELEQAQLVQLLSLVEPKSATQRVIIKAIFDNSNSPYKVELEQALEQDAQPDPMEQKMQEAQIQAIELDLMNKNLENATLATKLREIEANTLLKMAQLQTELSKPGVEQSKIQTEIARLQIEIGELAEFARQNDIAAMKALAQAAKTD